MANQDLSIYFAIMAVSAVLVLSSFVAVSRREKSWINWYTLPVAGAIAANYVLPSIFMWNFGIEASYYAFFYCYATYACLGLATAAGYLWLKPIRLGRTTKASLGRIGFLPWVLLLLGFVLYLPVIIEFREFLLQPREIYAHTRTGYGLNYFGSTLLLNLAFITYLFKHKKSIVGGSILMLSCSALVYLHGSKGQLIMLAFIGLLYWVYVKHLRVKLVTAAVILPFGALFVMLIFFSFGSAKDLGQLALEMAAYSNYTRDAVIVIDDPHPTYYWGQIEFEEQFYSRMPRLLAPNKPKVFGEFRLALKYFPEMFYSDAGSPSFGIGDSYADFGIFSILLICLFALIQGWLARSAVTALGYRPGVGLFLMLLFFAGISIIPLGSGYLLPETALLGIALDFVISGGLSRFFLLRPRPELEASSGNLLETLRAR